jgi:hypothetical protein
MGDQLVDATYADVFAVLLNRTNKIVSIQVCFILDYANRILKLTYECMQRNAFLSCVS